MRNPIALGIVSLALASCASNEAFLAGGTSNPQWNRLRTTTQVDAQRATLDATRTIQAARPEIFVSIR